MKFSRRAFDTLILAGAAATALGLTAGPVLAQAEAPAADAASVTIPADKIGVVGFTIRSQLGEDPRSTLEAVAACGITNIEFSGPSLDEAVPGFQGVPVPDLAAFAEEFGFNIPSLGVNGDDLTDRLDVVVDVANTLGASYVRISGVSDVEGEAPADYYARLAGVLNEAGPALAEEGITLLYHNHDQEFIDEVGDGMSGYDYLLAEVDPASAAFELDTYWSAVVGSDPATLIAENPGRFPLLHIKDGQIEADPEASTIVTVGQGNIDFASVFAASEAEGTEYYFIENDRPEPDGVTATCDSLEYLNTTFVAE